MIRTEALTKWFGDRCAVRDFEVDIGPKRAVGFLGLNGAGKTTTLRMLAGLLAPSSGRILIDGEDLAGPSGHRVRARIGFLPDRPPVYDDMLVEDYLAFAARLRGYSATPERIEAVVDRLDLTDVRREPIAHLSHGYRQRVGLAQAIVHDPILVLLDEPTSGLDPRQIVEMRTLVRKVAEDHTVVLSSHNLHEVQEICDEVLLIDQGKLVAQGTPAELQGRLEGPRALVVELVASEADVDALISAGRAEGWLTDGKRSGAADGAYRVSLKSTDAPEALAKRIFEAGLGLRRLEPGSDGLDDVFASLVRRADDEEKPS